ncbi:MAG: chalcone isomerase family protein [Syntrophobacteraceae bacterium]|jgi:hypothetical protein|nr:chalcone isomerase family protein [Syntrophobacteraceae bacterium]
MIDARKSTLAVLSAVALFMAAPPAVSARLVEGVYFTPRVVASDVPMDLNGVGLKTVWRFYKVSVAALYLGEGVKPSAVLSDVPKRLEIEYFHPISASDFITLTQKLLSENVDQKTLGSLQPRIDRFNALYRDVKPGDRYALTYTPGKGTLLELNGVEMGTIEGDDFASAVFAMWFGPKPLSKSLKLELLGRA